LKRGLAYYNGRIRTKELVSQFIEYYSTETLARLGCQIKHIYSNWLLRILHPSNPETAQHPIRHILLQVFLSCSAEELFAKFNEYKPFGEGPWPCLNRPSNHFGELRISDCRITDHLVNGKRGKPLGTFRCSCGFTYNRVGPDTSNKDRLRLTRVQSYGEMWEDALQGLWEDTNISLEDAARSLGVSKLTVIRHAIRLGLPMNTDGTRQVNGYERYKNYRRTWQEDLEHYRGEWLTLRRANRSASRNELIAMASFLYSWLRKNDSNWIEEHSPPVVKKNRRIKRINWNKEDRKLVAAIDAVAQRVNNLPGIPVRISVAAITRETGRRAWIERKLDHLPLTAKAIKTHVESFENHAIRKIAWAAACFRQEGIRPTRYQLIARAVVRNRTGTMLQVQNAIDTALERLNKQAS
jgi:hypothetical protein